MQTHRFGKVDHADHPYYLYIDVDRQGTTQVSRRTRTIARILRLSIVWICYRRTRRGWHLIVRLHDRTQLAERIAIQILCGSDRFRETLNLMRLRSIRTQQIRSRFWRGRANILYAEKLR